MSAAFRLVITVTLGLLFSTSLLEAQDWVWLKNRLQLGLQHCAFLEDAGSRIGLGAENVYVQSGSSIGSSLLRASEFDFIEDRPRFFVFPSGTVLAAGSTIDQSTYRVYRIANSDTGLAYNAVDLDGEQFGVGISVGDVTVLGNTTMRLRHAFTFDAGKTWHRMRNGDEISSTQSYHRIGNRGIFVSDPQSSQWYFVDTATRRYVPTSLLDSSVCYAAMLPSGAAMAMRCISGEETALVIRRDSTSAWEIVPPLAAQNGAVIDPKRSVYLNSQRLVSIDAGTALFLLDSGRAVEFDGNEVRLRTLSDSVIPGRFSSGYTLRPGEEDVIRAVYTAGPNSFVCLDISSRTGEVHSRGNLRFVPQDIDAEGYLSNGPYFTSWRTGITRPAIRLETDPSTLREQQNLPQVLLCGATPVTVAESGEVFVLDSLDKLPFLHTVRGAQRSQSTYTQTLLRRVTAYRVNDSTFLYPSLAPSLATISGQRMNMPLASILPQSAVITCGTVDANGRHLIAGNRIARLNDLQWDTIPYPERFRDTGVTISSLVTFGFDTIIAAGRGHGIGSSEAGGFRQRRGGVVVTTDGGTTWITRELPLQEQWVENMSKGPDNAIYCWATSMVFDAAYSQPANPMGRYGSARLYRSSDLGETWTELFVDETDEEIRRQAIDHQWSISFAGTNMMAISTPRAVYTVHGLNSVFTEVLDLPLTASFGGCALASDGTLWVTGSHGLHKRTIRTTSVAAEINATPSLVVFPNPVDDICTIRIEADAHSQLMPDRITLTSADGGISFHAQRNGSRYSFATSSMPQGAYIAHARIGRDIRTALVIVVHGPR
jgi:hypothetical protein